MSGLVTKHDAMATGILALARIAPSAAKSIWNGMGIIAQKSPTDNPVATVLRDGRHRSFLNIGLVNVTSHGLSLILG